MGIVAISSAIAVWILIKNQPVVSYRSSICRSRNYVRLENASDCQLKFLYPLSVVQYGFAPNGTGFSDHFKSRFRFVMKTIENLTCLKFDDIGDAEAASKLNRFGPYPAVIIEQFTPNLAFYGLLTCHAYVNYNKIYINVNYFMCGTFDHIMDLLLNVLGLETTRTQKQRQMDLIPHNLRELNIQELRQVCNLTKGPYITRPGPKDRVPSPPRHNLIPFHALKSLHKTYCHATCRHNVSCSNGGIPWVNTNHCAECICPYGLAGSRCTDVVIHNNSNPAHWCNGGVRDVVEGEVIPIGTGHTVGKRFSSPPHCTWLFRAPPTRKITLIIIKESFAYNCTSSCICRDFLDINTGEDLSVNEYRLCCRRPLGKHRIVSQTNQMLIISRVSHRGTNGFAGLIHLADSGDKSGFY